MASFEDGRKGLPSQSKKVGDFPAPISTWAKEKAKRTGEVTGCPGNLWLIHGNLYDLAPFIPLHPGGKEWIELTQGTDCSAEFETHHLNEVKVNALLKKYLVRPCPDGNKLAAYTFDEQGFYKTLKRAVFQELKVTGWGPSLQMKAFCSFAFVLYLLSFTNMLVSQSILSAVLAGITLYPLFGVGHNFFHARNSLWRYAFDFACFSHHDWRISHVLSHHHYPNLEGDLEATFFEPYLTYLRAHNTNVPGVIILWFVVCLILTPLEYTVRIISIIRGLDKIRPEFGIPVVMISLSVLAGGWHGLALYFLSHFVGNMGLLLISNPVHRSEHAWTVGCDSVRPARADFGEHSVIATNDFSTSAPLFAKLFIFASFSDHIIHHLFPTIDLSKQHLVRPLFTEHCKKFNVPYREFSFSDLVSGSIAVLRRKKGELLYTPADK